MCGPQVALAIGSTLFQAYSQYQQSSNQAKAAVVAAQNNQKIADYNAKVQEQNASYQRLAAVDALNRGAEEGAAQRQRIKVANAEARAEAANKGLVADSGIFGDIQDQNVTFGTVNSLTAQNNAEREAYGYKVRASDYDAEARNIRLQGDVGMSNARYQSSVLKQNGLLSAAGTLVTGASKVYDNYFYTPSAPTASANNDTPWVNDVKAGRIAPNPYTVY